MKLTKQFTQEYASRDMEARYFQWEDTAKNYDDIKNSLETRRNAWLEGVRVVEKTFDSDTFEITIVVIKEATRQYTEAWELAPAKETIYIK